MRIEDALKNAAQALSDCTMHTACYTPALVRDMLDLEHEIAETLADVPEPLTAEMHRRIEQAVDELAELAGVLADAARRDPLHRVMLAAAADGLCARWGFHYYSRH